MERWRQLPRGFVRAFSHGCVRVQHVDALAAWLVADRDRFSAALAGDQTRSCAVARPWRAVIVYFILTASTDGNPADLGDPYKLDEAVAAALDGRRAPPAVPKSTLVKPPNASPPEPHHGPDDTAVRLPKIDTIALSTTSSGRQADQPLKSPARPAEPTGRTAQ